MTKEAKSHYEVIVVGGGCSRKSISSNACSILASTPPLFDFRPDLGGNLVLESLSRLPLRPPKAILMAFSFLARNCSGLIK